MSSKEELLKRSAEALLEAFGCLKKIGTERTPERFAAVFLNGDGQEDPKEILKKALITDRKYTGLVLENGLSFFSLCEHHLLPYYGTATIGYIPEENRLVGLSKLPRALRCLASGPTLQEELTEKVADVLDEVLRPKAVGVIISAWHMCMVARGVRIDDSRTVTSAMRGLFLEQGSSTRAEFLSLRRRDG